MEVEKEEKIIQHPRIYISEEGIGFLALPAQPLTVVAPSQPTCDGIGSSSSSVVIKTEEIEEIHNVTSHLDHEQFRAPTSDINVIGVSDGITRRNIEERKKVYDSSCENFEWLPPGWTVAETKRNSGTTIDRCIRMSSGKSFRSFDAAFKKLKEMGYQLNEKEIMTNIKAGRNADRKKNTEK